MTKYVHIVQVHPVENGLPNLSKFWSKDAEFETENDARDYVEFCNNYLHLENDGLKAVYVGRVNDITGELE